MQWEFSDDNGMYQNLVGSYHGPDPLENKEKIASGRIEVAKYYLRLGVFRKCGVALEIGSGAGHMAEFLSEKVDRIFCVDISQSFLNVASKRCLNCTNVTFHKIVSAKFDFISDASIDAVYTHAVFIHLNIYDIYLYLIEIRRVMRPGARAVIDFLVADEIDFSQNPFFQETLGHYSKSPLALPELLFFNSEKILIRMIRSLGFVTLLVRGSGETKTVVLAKTTGSKFKDFILQAGYIANLYRAELKLRFFNN